MAYLDRRQLLLAGGTLVGASLACAKAPME